MKILSVEDFLDFACVGDKCPITCCGGSWAIFVDKESEAKYQKVPGDFGDKLRDGLMPFGGRTKFRLNEKGDCIFLDACGLCEIYKNLGPDSLSLVCKTFPRESFQVGDILFQYMSNSCPEITRRVLQREKPFQVIIADAETKESCEKTDWTRFNYAIKAYTTGMDLLQNSELWVQERLALLLVFTKQFQDMMRQGRDPSGLINAFASPDVYVSLLNEIPIYQRDYQTKIDNFVMVFRAVMSMSYAHPMWKGCNELANSLSADREVDYDRMEQIVAKGDSNELQKETEQLIAYRFFSAFMKGFEATDYYEQVVYEIVLYAALLGYITLTELVQEHECTQEERILFYSLCSRTDHNRGNKQDLKDEIKKAGFDRLEILFKLIS